MVIQVSDGLPDAHEQFELEFHKHLKYVLDHLNVANAEIDIFNEELPDIVRDTIADRVKKMRQADTLTAMLTRSEIK